MIYLTQVDSYTAKTTEETTDKYISPQVTTSPLSIDICLGHTLYKLTILEDPQLRLIFKLCKILPAQVCISCYFVFQRPGLLQEKFLSNVSTTFAWIVITCMIKDNYIVNLYWLWWLRSKKHVLQYYIFTVYCMHVYVYTSAVSLKNILIFWILPVFFFQVVPQFLHSPHPPLLLHHPAPCPRGTRTHPRSQGLQWGPLLARW